MFRRLAASLCLFVAGFAAAQSCAEFGSQLLEIEGFGTARFGALDYDSQSDTAELRGGVCILDLPEPGSKPRWRIVGTSMQVVGLQGTPSFTLRQASLELQGWTLFAESLSSVPGSLDLKKLSFKGASARGRAESGRFDLDTGHLSMHEVEARGDQFRVRGETATLEGERLLFRDAMVTTCVCEGGALYVVAAPSASLDLARERVLVESGVLKIGNIEIALGPQVEFSEASFDRLRFPLVVSESSTTGLTVRTIPLPLAKDLGLEVGITRLDEDSPQGIFLIVVEGPGLDLTFGAAPEGFQADLRREQALTNWLTFAFGIRNRDWAAADYLHEGYVGLEASRSLAGLLAEDRFDLRAGMTAAASSQILGKDRVVSPRLNVQARATYTLSETVLGTLGLDLRGSFSIYPRYGTSQFGLGISPSWQGRTGPLTASLRYEGMLTDSGSPFGTSLDRLSPQSRLSAQAGVTGAIPGSVQAEVDASFRYDLLADGVEDSAIESAMLSAQATFGVGGGKLTPSFQLELARLLDPSQDPDAKAYLRGELAFEDPAFEAGFYADYNLQAGTLDALELSAGLPIDLPPLTFRPFLAVDFADAVSGTGPMRLTGHGLELTYRGCCGTVTVGYRLHRGTLSTTMSVTLPASMPADDE